MSLDGFFCLPHRRIYSITVVFEKRGHMVAPFFETIYAYSFIFVTIMRVLKVKNAGFKFLDAFRGCQIYFTFLEMVPHGGTFV